MTEQFKITGNLPEKPLLIWDGECEFCRYWTIRLKNLLRNSIQYATFQKIASSFPEIPRGEFRRSVILIDTSGKTYSGAAAAFKALEKGKRPFFMSLYFNNAFFRNTSELIYRKISDNRPVAYKITKVLWGANPHSPKSYWLFYLTGLIVVISLLRKRN